MTLLITLFFVVIFISFLCSILESVLLSTNLPYIAVLEEENPEIGKLLKKLKQDIDKSISAILILNTFANTLGATFIGVVAQTVFGNESDLIIVISIVLTFSILFFSEIIPKTIGAVYWKTLAPIATRIIYLFTIITYPIIVITMFVTKKINKKNGKEIVSREELIQSALLSEEGGTINDIELDLIENTLKLKEIKIKDIYTPRSVVFSVQKDTPIQNILEDKKTYKFSRVPVYGNSIDNIVGIVLTKRIFKYAIKNPNITIENIMRKANTINENIPVLKALNRFTKTKDHMLIVVDGYGQTQGIVTLEDCLETLLGLEIMDELDTTEDMRKLATKMMKVKRKKFIPQGKNNELL
ncbi:MAG: hemolysin family protein [Arcobacteraceae bacterium]|jgi:CBS domain containing-hemolysin-like protein|nr:hemolysin family protein [Arcobacteraceae bacterium]